MKMKKNIFIVGVLLLVVALAGCAVAKDVIPEENSQLKDEKISFEKVNYEDLDSEMQSTIDAKKTDKGHMLIKDKSSDEYYLIVFAGEKPNGGYGIEITEVISGKDTTNVIVKEIEPAKDMMTIQVITYPMDIIKLKGISNNINVIIDSSDDYVTIGEIIEFEKDGVHILTGDIAEIFKVDKENLEGFYLGETVGVKEVGDNKFELEAYKQNDFTVRHTSMGDIISTVTGKVKEVNGKKLVISTKDGDIEFEAYDELFYEKGMEVTVDYIEIQQGAEKTVLDIYDEASKIELTVKNISRAQNGKMILATEDAKDLKYEVYVLVSTVLNFNHSDLKVDDKIVVYPGEIRESYPAQVDAKMIKK